MTSISTDANLASLLFTLHRFATLLTFYILIYIVKTVVFEHEAAGQWFPVADANFWGTVNLWKLAHELFLSL